MGDRSRVVTVCGSVLAVLLAAGCGDDGGGGGGDDGGDGGDGGIDAETTAPDAAPDAAPDECMIPIEEGWTVGTASAECDPHSLEIIDFQLVVDGDGHGHAAFASHGSASGTAEALYATNRSGAWAVEVVDPDAQRINSSALALDSASTPHVVYGRTVGGLVRYATKSGDTWTVEDVGRGTEPTAAFDPDGVLRIAYDRHVLTGDGSLQLAVRGDTGWTSELVDDPGSESSIAVRDDGTIEIAYATGSGIRHAVRPPGGTWTFTDVGPGARPRIALSPTGATHIVWIDNERGYHASNEGGTWTTSTILPEVDRREYPPAIAVDGDGVAHVAIARMWCGLYYATRAPGASSWTVHRVDGDSSLQVQVAIALDSDGAPHLAHCLGDLRYVRPAAP